MTKVVYNRDAELDLAALIPEYQQKVKDWAREVQMPSDESFGYLNDVVGPVKIWFQVEKREIHVTDIRVTA